MQGAIHANHTKKLTWLHQYDKFESQPCSFSDLVLDKHNELIHSLSDNL